MAVNSKADKTSGHKSSGLSRVQYAQAAGTATAPPAALASGLVAGGSKALGMRARKVLSAVADLTQSIAE